MASHLLWFRLPKGRVWHVACSGSLVALCGQTVPSDRGERQPKRPPFGARPCPDCEAVAVEAQVAIVGARAKLASPPQSRPALGQMPLHARFPDCAACEHSFDEHGWDGACLEGGPEGCRCTEYQAACTCGHPWALHDVDSAECTEPRSDDDSGDQCPCSAFVAVTP